MRARNEDPPPDHRQRIAQALCDRLSKSDFVAVDTEFMRENTFWPDLCLMQIGNEEEAAAVDPKAEGIDLEPCSTCSSTMRTF